MLGRVNGFTVKIILDRLIFVIRKAHFRPLVPFLHVKKFVVVGVKVDFSVKL